VVIGVPHKHFLDDKPERPESEAIISQTAFSSAVAKMRRLSAIVKEPIDVALSEDEVDDLHWKWMEKLESDMQGDLEAYLADTENSKVRTMVDLINFNDRYSVGHALVFTGLKMTVFSTLSYHRISGVSRAS
jgi:hypothetical protein